MATYDDLKTTISGYANGLAIGDTFPAGRSTWGTGADITWQGEDYEVEKAWVSGGTFDTLVHGLADWADSVGAGDVGAMKSALNTLIGEFNQLLSDYNAATVPSTAIPVVPVP